MSDHIETLYEVDMLFAEAAERAGITSYRRTEALNTSPLFISALAGLVRDHLAASGQRPCAACASGRSATARTTRRSRVPA